MTSIGDYNKIMSDRELFNKKEIKNIISYTESHKERKYAVSYDNDLYGKDTHDNRIWEVEKSILNELFLRIDKTKDVLDFACGTGRVAKFIENYGFENVFGFDVSDEMLKIASKKLNRTELINVDINKQDIIKYKNKFGLVTAFRFFLNAEDELKDITFKNINRLIKKDGYLVFNVHGNKNSLRFFYILFYNFKQKIKYFIFKRKKHIFTYKKQLSISEVKKYLTKYNFKLVETISYSFLTNFLNFLLPRNFFIFLEKKLSSKKILFGTHFIFIAKKL